MTDQKPQDINLSDPEHIECPYRAYQALHQTGGLGRDPNIGVVVAGYETLATLAKNTDVYSSSISEDGHGPRHMGINPEPVQDDVEAILAHAHPIVNALFTADPPYIRDTESSSRKPSAHAVCEHWSPKYAPSRLT